MELTAKLQIDLELVEKMMTDSLKEFELLQKEKERLEQEILKASSKEKPEAREKG